MGSIILAMSGPTEAQENTTDGNYLLENCNVAIRFLDEKHVAEGDDAVRLGYCLGFLEATRNVIMILEAVKGNHHNTCFPEGGINNGQASRIVVKYLKDHPADLNNDKTLLAMLSFKDAYPCK